jgi:hypothetical protein
MSHSFVPCVRCEPPPQRLANSIRFGHRLQEAHQITGCHACCLRLDLPLGDQHEEQRGLLERVHHRAMEQRIGMTEVVLL